MTDQIDGKAVERLRGYAKDMQHLDDLELYEDGAALLALLSERDALQKQVGDIRQQRDVAVAAMVRNHERAEKAEAALAREGAVAMEVRERIEATLTDAEFGEPVLRRVRAIPLPTAPSAALARREDEVLDGAIVRLRHEVTINPCLTFSDAIEWLEALKRSAKEAT